MNENEQPEEQLQEEKKKPEKPRKKGVIIFITLILILLVLSLLIPFLKVNTDPEPIHIKIEQLGMSYSSNNESRKFSSNKDFLALIEPQNPLIKQTSNKIVSLACPKLEKVCQAKALFYFVRDNIKYVSDPESREYLASAEQTLFTKVGDCDDLSILLANLLQATGFEIRFVFVPNHVFVQVKIPEALKRYKHEQNWVDLDATCKDCSFGEVGWQSFKQKRSYL